MQHFDLISKSHSNIKIHARMRELLITKNNETG